MTSIFVVSECFCLFAYLTLFSQPNINTYLHGMCGIYDCALQGFMTGALQNHARKYQISIDRLSYSFVVREEAVGMVYEECPIDGVLVSGLFMDGAQWDAKKHVVAEQKIGELYAAMPAIHFLPVVDHKPLPDRYICPVYKTSVRKGQLSTTGASTNFILALELPTDPDKHSPDHWILRGVACLTQLDD